MIKRKIIIIGPAFPLRGGIANFNNALAEEFNKQGYNVKLYSFSLQYPSFLFPGKTQYEEGDPPDNLIIKTCINSINPINWIRVANEINHEKPDYIIMRYWLPFMSPCLGTISRLINSNIKVLAITDNIVPHEKRIGDKLFTNYFIKSCDAFVTLSLSVLEDLKIFTNSQNKIYMPHPIYDIFGDKVSKEEALLNLNLSPSDKHLLFFGFIRKYKGLDLLLKAMADERIKLLGVKLIIAGEFYDNEQEYLDMISDFGIKDKIILRNDFIPSVEVKEYFCAADMITQTYKTATQSGVTQIAYHFERPMLVTNVGGLSEIVPNKKVGYVTSQSSIKIADAIYDFYKNEREKEFEDNIAIEKKRFSWFNFVKGIEELMSSF